MWEVWGRGNAAEEGMCAVWAEDMQGVQEAAPVQGRESTGEEDRMKVEDKGEVIRVVAKWRGQKPRRIVSTVSPQCQKEIKHSVMRLTVIRKEHAVPVVYACFVIP